MRDEGGTDLKLAEDKLQAGPEEIRALEEAFEHFSRQTAQLKQAYEELKERADQVNLELEQANRELERKVQELDEAYNFQHSILESIPTAVVVTDLEGRVRTFNAAAERMWGVRREEARDRHYKELMAPHHLLLERVLGGGSAQEAERRELDGPEPRVISSTACLVENSAGRPIGAVQLDRDITRLCDLQTELYRQGKLADLGKMAAGLAHEIRKPLNGIKGFASILRRSLEEDQKHERYVNNIVGAADRLNGLLTRLLDFARPDSVRLVRCDLREEAEQIAEFVRAEHPDAPAQIAVAVRDDARWVSADPDKLKQILLNLVQNAVEVLNEEEGEVTVAATPGDEEVWVEVRDTGPGMAPDQVEKIMEPFYTGKENGTGLGLCIVHRILQLHGARLEVDSEPGRGTVMSFGLPPATSEEK
ncbi:MAG: ATP-binding protein [Candidatus Brocadiia bacterium]